MALYCSYISKSVRRHPLRRGGGSHNHTLTEERAEVENKSSM
jgi:hypothetical protein